MVPRISNTNLTSRYVTADTVVLTHPPPGLSSTPRFVDEPAPPQDILEKPTGKDDNMRMLLDLNGGICEVVTGVTVGRYPGTFASVELGTGAESSLESLSCA